MGHGEQIILIAFSSMTFVIVVSIAFWRATRKWTKEQLSEQLSEQLDDIRLDVRWNKERVKSHASIIADERRAFFGALSFNVWGKMN